MSRRFGCQLAAIGLMAIVASAGTLVGHAAPAATSHRHVAAYGTIWAANPNSNSITEYAPGASGNARPIARIVGSKTGLDEPAGLAVDRTGTLWVANYSGKSIESFAPGAKGNVRPASRIAGAATGLFDPFGLAVMANGNVWVTDEGANDIAEFARTANGNVAPLRTISGATTTIGIPYAIAVSPDQQSVWVVNGTQDFSPGFVLAFSSHANGDVAPVRTISGPHTHLDDPESGIVVDLAGRIHVSTVKQILTFSSGATGDATPAVITGTKTHLRVPEELALDARGNLWTADIHTQRVSRFPKAAVGNHAPDRTIKGSRTKLGNPWGVAVFASSPSAPRPLNATVIHHHVRLSWKTPRHSGGGVRGYVVSRSGSHGSWTVVAVTKQRTIVDKSAQAPGSRYRIAAYNAIGISPAATVKAPKH